MKRRFSKMTIRKALGAAFAFAWLAYFHFVLDWTPRTPSAAQSSEQD